MLTLSMEEASASRSAPPLALPAAEGPPDAEPAQPGQPRPAVTAAAPPARPVSAVKKRVVIREEAGDAAGAGGWSSATATPPPPAGGGRRRRERRGACRGRRGLRMTRRVGGGGRVWSAVGMAVQLHADETRVRAGGGGGGGGRGRGCGLCKSARGEEGGGGGAKPRNPTDEFRWMAVIRLLGWRAADLSDSVDVTLNGIVSKCI